jgi:CDP-diacylglycerol---serine O-phosphatidyltransferase
MGKVGAMKRMIPNALTMLALCSGLTAFRFAFNEDWHAAVLCIVAAAILDALDGRAARMLGLSSRFGAELDSLSDFFAFGVAPAMLVYLWALHQAGGIGWVIAMLYCICMALRLARFNTALETPNLPPWAKNFFTGVPAPAAAGIALFPMILSFQTDATFIHHPAFVIAVLIVVAGLMVSRLPTYSFKNVHIPKSLIWLPVLGIVAIGVAAVLVPWFTLSLLIALYIALLPFASISFRRRASAAV